MEVYAQAVLYIIPMFLILMLGELIKLVSLKDLLGLTIVVVYSWLFDMVLVEIESTILNYVICFMCVDFASYWKGIM